MAIIVPTKALIDQTYREAKKHIKDRKLIIYDQNYVYEKDKRVLAIVTQERALRLIEEGMIFELLYIDEAHELLNFNYQIHRVILSISQHLYALIIDYLNQTVNTFLGLFLYFFNFSFFLPLKPSF